MSTGKTEDEQARELEIVARALLRMLVPSREWEELDADRREPYERHAQRVLAALEPIRAAERQEAAREALLAAADALGSDPSGAAALETFRADDGRMSLRVAPIDQWLRDRADGVTGRSES